MLLDFLIHIMSYISYITQNFINQSITCHALRLLQIPLHTLKNCYNTEFVPLYFYDFSIYLVGGSEHILFHQLAHSWHSPSISCNNINCKCQETIMCLYKIYYSVKRNLQVWLGKYSVCGNATESRSLSNKSDHQIS